MTKFLLIFLLMMPLSNLLAQDLSDEKATSLIKGAVEKEPKEIYSVSMSDSLKDFIIEEINIIKRGKFNKEKGYWPIRARVKGKALLVLWGNSNPLWAKKDIDRFDKIIEVRLKTNDFDEWEVEIVKIKNNTQLVTQKNKKIIDAYSLIRNASNSMFENNNREIKKIILTYGSLSFNKYCSVCHQKNGKGIVGKYPDLTDDDWLWGGNLNDIKTSITKGRKGRMPAHKTSLSDKQITEVANYVLSLSGETTDSKLVAKGKEIFNTKGCSGCHTSAATGMKALGSANLTDKIWTLANVPNAKSTQDKLKEIMSVINNGVLREMPAWKEKLTEGEINLLAFYVKYLIKEQDPLSNNKLVNKINLFLNVNNRSEMDKLDLKEEMKNYNYKINMTSYLKSSKDNRKQLQHEIDLLHEQKIAKKHTTYEKSCAVCHKTGVAGAPKTQNQFDWNNRLSQGINYLVNSSLNGKGACPPKGGVLNTTEKDIKEAILFMTRGVK